MDDNKLGQVADMMDEWTRVENTAYYRALADRRNENRVLRNENQLLSQEATALELHVEDLERRLEIFNALLTREIGRSNYYRVLLGKPVLHREHILGRDANGIPDTMRVQPPYEVIELSDSEGTEETE